MRLLHTTLNTDFERNLIGIVILKKRTKNEILEAITVWPKKIPAMMKNCSYPKYFDDNWEPHQGFLGTRELAVFNKKFNAASCWKQKSSASANFFKVFMHHKKVFLHLQHIQAKFYFKMNEANRIVIS